jgi:hypothetical protein
VQIAGPMTRQAVVFSLAVLNAASCASEQRAEPVVVRDSAGVEIVENSSPAWSAEERWQVADTPAIVIGGQGWRPEQELFAVYHAILHDSTIVVANNGTSELRMFDWSGASVGVVGGQGEGPGEFSGLRGVHGCRDGRLLAIELRRISVLSSAGEFIRSVRLAPDRIPTPGNVVGVFPDCSAVVVERGETAELPVTSEVYHMPAVLALVPLEGDGAETLAHIDGPALVNVPVGSGSAPQRVPWGYSPTYAVGDGVVFVGASDSSEVRVFGGSGLERIIRWPAARKPVAEADRLLFDEQRAAAAAQDGGRLAGLLPSLDDYPHVPDRKPAYARLMFDPAGFVWVREYQDIAGWRSSGWELDLDNASEGWWIFDAAGRWLGSADVPPGLRILGVQGDYLLAIAFDANDVERLQLHAIDRHGSGRN